MYEYAGSESDEVLYLVNSTFDELFKRSPEILNKHKTKGTNSVYLFTTLLL